MTRGGYYCRDCGTVQSLPDGACYCRKCGGLGLFGYNKSLKAERRQDEVRR